MNTRIVGLVVAFSCLLSCSLSDEPGRFSMSFKCDTPPDGEIFLWVRVEERVASATSGPILASAGPSSYVHGEPFELTMDSVANGDDRVIVVEAREGESAGLPVLYYGLSEPFSLSPGMNVAVDVPMELQTPEADEMEASVTLEFEEGPLATVNKAQLEFAHLVTRSTGAVKIVAANDASFTAGLQTWELGTEHFPCEKEEDGDGVLWDVCTSSEWNLLEGLPSEADGLYTVFVKFVDKNGYESQVYKSAVELDTQAPLVVAASASPEVVAGGATLALTVSFHEELHPDPTMLQLWVEPEDGNLSFGEPTQVGTSNSWGWLADVPTQQEDDGNEYTFTVGATDVGGNTNDPPQALTDAQGTPLVVRVDPVGPAVVAPEEIVYSHDLFPIPAEGDELELTFDFVLRELNPVERGAPDGPCLLCPEVVLSGSAMGEVTRRADADNPDAEEYSFSYRYILDEEAWDALEHKVPVTIRWVDKANNMTQETLPQVVVFDFMRPEAVSCSLAPEFAGGGDIVTYKIIASEPLAAPPELVVEFGPEGLFGQEAQGEEATWQWSQDAFDLDDGEYSLSARLTDEAGNDSNGTVCAVQGAVDSTLPILSPHIPLSINPTLFGIADDESPEENLLEFQFGYIEPLPTDISNEHGPCAGTCPQVFVGDKEVGTVLRLPSLDEQQPAAGVFDQVLSDPTYPRRRPPRGWRVPPRASEATSRARHRSGHRG